MELSAIGSLNSKGKKKSGGFQSMGLCYPVLKAILRKGYKIPTPIQRKCIPVIMNGVNVVAMARTGSGKTAAFLIPMLEKLKCRVPKSGARALIFSPTRELALQTMRFTKELGKNTGLKSVLVLGGEKIEAQFAAMHESPDIIVATPGRFLHVVVEMDLKLSSIEYVVFDEADRLFEMGFQEQLQEVLNRLPLQCQTLLFSATLPDMLAGFVKAGIRDPMLIRLDVDMQISENLKSSYLLCRSDDKTAVLLYLLKTVIDVSDELTVVFLATKHHIEYLKEILQCAGIQCSYIYSSLDQTARKIEIARFKSRKVGVLLVTDIAARGMDIPLLDNVINYNFPASSKLYVHRVGRVARAGRSGKAYSLVSSDEVPFLLDLHLFLGKPLNFASPNKSSEDGMCGSVPQSIIDDETDSLMTLHEASTDILNMQKVVKNAYAKYIKSRPTPSSESVRRIKEYPFALAEIHPMFVNNDTELERNKILSNMKIYRPNTTIFELGPLAKTQASVVMRQKRKYHTIKEKVSNAKPEDNDVEMAIEEDSTFNNVSVTFKTENHKKRHSGFKDDENYLHYVSTGYYKEKGLGLQSPFQQAVDGAILDLAGDDAEVSKKIKNAWQWDRKKKKFVREESEKVKKMKTESGVWIPKSYKSNIYKKWQEKNKVKYQDNDSEEDNAPRNKFGMNRHIKTGKKQKNGASFQGQKNKREMRSKEEILKSRKRKSQMMHHQKKKKQGSRTKSFKGKGKGKK